MRLYKKLTYSLAFAIIVLAASMFFDFIPCQTAPVIPNPEFAWKLCSQNPDSAFLLGVVTKYWAYTSSLRESYTITLVVSFILAFAILTLLTKKHPSPQKQSKDKE